MSREATRLYKKIPTAVSPPGRVWIPLELFVETELCPTHAVRITTHLTTNPWADDREGLAPRQTSFSIVEIDLQVSHSECKRPPGNKLDENCNRVVEFGKMGSLVTGTHRRSAFVRVSYNFPGLLFFKLLSCLFLDAVAGPLTNEGERNRLSLWRIM